MKSKPARKAYALADLQNWQDSDPPIRLGVLGDPVEHSLSPELQNAALQQSKIKMQYARFHILARELPEGFRLIRDLKFVGVNLTLPHKVRALDLLDEVDRDAKRSGAVNTVAIRDGKLIGFDTDGPGFSRAIREEFAVDLRDLRILVLGAGGAARAIAFQCARENCERLVIANRTFANAETLTKNLSEFFVGPRVLGPVARLQAIPWEDAALRFQIANTDLVVNATPLGLSANDGPPIPARLLQPHLMVYDAVYARGQSRTPFVTAAMEAGARAASGLSMLVHQGARAFEIWFGSAAPIEAMRKACSGGL